MIVYLHGLNSSDQSVKAGILRERFADIGVITPNYPAHRAEQAIKVLSVFFRDLMKSKPSPLLVVGSSMGGFFGQYLARRFPFDRLIMINPALRPWELLLDYLGEHELLASGEKYDLRHEHVEAYRQYDIEPVCDGMHTTLLLDKGDEVIDYRVAVDKYQDCGEIVLFEGGNHGFAHMDEAMRVIAEIHSNAVRNTEHG